MRTLPRPERLAKGLSDAELLAAVSAGDLGALGALYDRHAREVWRVLDRVTQRSSDVEDILHATFLHLPRIASRFDGRSPSCAGWLCGVATRLALRHGRGLRRFTAMLSRYGTATPRAHLVSPESQAVGREDLGVLDRALEKLSPDKRAVFVLIECEGLTHGDVADALGIPLPTVRTRLFAAKNRLREALEGRGRRSP